VAPSKKRRREIGTTPTKNLLYEGKGLINDERRSHDEGYGNRNLDLSEHNLHWIKNDNLDLRRHKPFFH
jgi:hypothetical protein